MTKWTVVALRTAPDAQGRISPTDVLVTAWTTGHQDFRSMISWAATVVPAEAVYIGITRSEEP